MCQPWLILHKRLTISVAAAGREMEMVTTVASPPDVNTMLRAKYTGACMQVKFSAVLRGGWRVITLGRRG